MKFIIFSLLSLLLLTTSQLPASIVNTKHNLSVSNTVVPNVGETIIKATQEAEICVFCHIPHQARDVGNPLWNRSMPDSQYTMYDSDYLRRLGYPAVEADLGTGNNTPGALSRQCLSCHDGTIAVGAVYKLRRDFMNGSTIAMDGVDASGYIPAESSTSFGVDLSNHHPVGIVYDPTPTINFSDETRGMELKTILDPDTQVKLFEYNGVNYVECSSCHDPHKENTKFLREDSSTIHAQNVVNTCTSCHDKTGWTGSVHQTATQTYTDVDIMAKYGSSTVGDLGCANCHTPHNAESTGYLNRKVQASTCYQGAASSIDGANCHGVGGAKDIESIIGKTYSHPVDDSTTSEKHTNLDVLYGTGVAADNALGIAWDTNKHAVCMDCHNPHQAKAGTHVTIANEWYEAKGIDGNKVSPALTGVTGVQPNPWPSSKWTQPIDFDILNSATKEYQICLKCHSYWGVGPSVTGATGYISTSGAILTDVALEMNVNNRSGHPVIMSNSQRPLVTEGGSAYEPRALATEQLMPPWNAFPGTNTMYCSDCHGNDTEAGGDPKGPHGSTLKYILKGENQHWPFNASGVLYTMDDIGTAGDTGLFCKNCHDIAYPHDQWWNKMANRGFKCIECHVAVPHGSPVSRLLGYDTFPSPYNYSDAEVPNGYLKMSGYRKNLTVDQNDAWAPNSATCNSNSCHKNSDSANGAYDDAPF